MLLLVLEVDVEREVLELVDEVLILEDVEDVDVV